MALVVSGSIVISAASGQPATDSFGTMKSCAAQVLNGENQQKILELAGKGILRGIDDINMRHVFRFGSKQATDVNLSSGVAEYDLLTDFFAVHEVQLIDAGGDPARTLQYIPWGQFNDLVHVQDGDGKPKYWTSRNTFDDGVISVYPVPGDKDAADYDLRVTYYERVERPSADSDIIAAPRELSDVLCTYAEYYILFVRDRANATAWGFKQREYERKLNMFMQMTEREPTEKLQWRVGVDSDTWGDEFDVLRGRRL